MTTENYDFASNIDMAKAMNRMNDIEREIAEKQDAEVCKAFTISITKLLRENGIVPIMTQTEQKFETQYDKSKVVLKKSFGVCFNELDTSEHDAKVMAYAIDNCIKDLEQCYPLVDNGDILYGFSCAIHRLKQLKEKNNG